MKPCNDYPVTFAYKAQDGKYYGPNGSVGLYHRGEDRACPKGSPIIVQGVTIGLVGATGLASGPHLHFQCMRGSRDVSPVPYRWAKGKVTTAGWHSQFGNQVRITHADGTVMIYAHLSKINVSVGQVLGGTTMATINDDVSRQIGFHFLGRNGKDGKPNALNSRQGDLYGKPLTNAQMSTFFLSAESREWRDSRLPKIYAERDALKDTNANLTTVNTQLSKAVEDKDGIINVQKGTIVGLQNTIDEKQQEIDVLVDENAKLRQQLEDCGTTPDPDSIVISKSWWDNAFEKIKAFFK